MRRNSARRAWPAAGLFGTLLAVSLFWISATRNDDVPQIRVTSSGNAFTAQIVDGRHSILIANATSANEARSALGALRRPWDARPSLIITHTSESVAEGLLETLDRLDPEHVIVAGAPGDSTVWTKIERYCRDHDISITYVGVVATLDLPRLSASIVPPSASGPSYVAISRGDVRIAVALSGLPEHARFHVAVVAGGAIEGTRTDLLVTSDRESEELPGSVIELDRDGRLVLLVDEGRIRARGGHLFAAGVD